MKLNYDLLISAVGFGTKLILVQLPKLMQYLTSVLPPVESKKAVSLKHLEILER